MSRLRDMWYHQELNHSCRERNFQTRLLTFLEETFLKRMVLLMEFALALHLQKKQSSFMLSTKELHQTFVKYRTTLTSL